MEEVKKPYRLYKGEETTIAKITKTAGIHVLQRIEPKPDEKRLPKFMVAFASMPSWDAGSRYVNTFDPIAGNTTLRNLPLTTKFHELKGRQAKTLLNEYFAYVRSNLVNILQRSNNRIGTDPEIFVVKEKEETEIVPAWTFLGSKKNPTPVSSIRGNATAYWDGFQAEFTVASELCLAYLNDNIQAGLATIYKSLPEGAKLSHLSVLPVNPETLASAKDEHVEFGCMPSKNIHGIEGSHVPGRQCMMRFAGGHVHLELTADQKKRIPEIVRSLDLILGLPSVSLFSAWDNPVRREYYGLPGEYRTPAHGVEYRTLSNAWLIHPLLSNIVFEIARIAKDYGYEGHSLIPWRDEIVDIIQKSDVDRARKFMAEHEAEYKQVFKCTPPFNGSQDTLFRVFMRGAHEYIGTTDIAQNWNLAKGWVYHCDGDGKNWRLALPTLRQEKKV